MNKQLRADLLLMMISIFWGASYMLTKIGLQTLEPYNLTAYRFIIAFIVAAAVFYKNIIKSDIKTIKYSFILALILFAVFITQTFALKYSLASNVGFLVSLTVIFIPIISYIFLKQKIERKILIGIFFALVGIALMTLNGRLLISWGDSLSILCAMLFAVHVIVTGIFTRNVDSISLSVLQLGFVGLFNLVFSFATETIKLPADSTTWIAILCLSILCTSVGYIVQTTAQKYTSATHTGLILSLEPVFSSVFAFLVLGEILSSRAYIGAVILLFGVLIAEIDFKGNNSKGTDVETV